MLSNRHVVILMATFNGEKYLRQQVDSIINQTYKNWDLYIRDDGSDDSTTSIIKTYVENYTNIHNIVCDTDKHGACINFYELLVYAKAKLSKSDYFMLSDQDDIWEPFKIEQEVNVCEKSNSKYVLAYSNLSLMSAENSKLNGTMGDLIDIELKNPLDIFFNQIFIWGNTICINRELLNLINIPNNIANSLSHDHYLAFYGASYGHVIYIDKPLVRYRRHDDNVSDLPRKYNLLSAICRLLRRGNKILKDHALSYSNVLYFIKNAPQCTEAMGDILLAIEKGGMFSLRIINKYKIKPGNSAYNILINKLILFSCLYKKYLQ